jgi:hypothetical protein
MTIVPYIFQLPFIIQIQNKLGSLVFGFSLGLWVFGSLGLWVYSIFQLPFIIQKKLLQLYIFMIEGAFPGKCRNPGCLSPSDFVRVITPRPTGRNRVGDPLLAIALANPTRTGPQGWGPVAWQRHDAASKIFRTLYVHRGGHYPPPNSIVEIIVIVVLP